MPKEYVNRLVAVFSEAYRVLRPNGMLWLNMGDSYNGSDKINGVNLDNCLQMSNKLSQQMKPTKIKGLKPKDLIGIPLYVDVFVAEGGLVFAARHYLAQAQSDASKRLAQYLMDDWLFVKNK